jgi:hypothetical protein
MKNKISKIRFEKDLELIRKVLNAVVFIEPIQKRKNFQEVCTALIFDFINAVQHSEMFGPKRTTEELYVADVGENPTMVHIAEVYLELFSTLAKTGCGFSPKLAIDKRKTIEGYNCLGKALAFGSYLMIHKLNPYLVRTIDHAMCMFKEDDISYLCDPSSGKIHMMHGTVTHHDNYSWYVSNSADDFHFNFLVIQDFEVGGLNAIFQSLEFLSKIGWKQGAVVKSSLVDCEVSLFNIMDPKLGYREKICSIDWKNLRRHLFGDIDDYTKKYAREWLLEAERIGKRRIALDISHQFNEVVFSSVCATRYQGNITDFHNRIIHELRPVAENVITYLTMEFDKLPVRVSSESFEYLSMLKKLISQDPMLKEYTIAKIQSKFLDTAV